jgi:hypothetical protein
MTGASLDPARPVLEVESGIGFSFLPMDASTSLKQAAGYCCLVDRSAPTPSRSCTDKRIADAFGSHIIFSVSSGHAPTHSRERRAPPPTRTEYAPELHGRRPVADGSNYGIRGDVLLNNFVNGVIGKLGKIL